MYQKRLISPLIIFCTLALSLTIFSTDIFAQKTPAAAQQPQAKQVKQDKKEKPKEQSSSSWFSWTNKKVLSMGFNTSIIADLAGMGRSIMMDGALPLNKGSLAYATSTDKLLMSDQNNAVLAHSSKNTNFGPAKVMDAAFKEGGPMIGTNLGLYTMYDANAHLGVPIFVRAGYYYTVQISKNEQVRTIGSGVDQAAAASGFPAYAGGYAGGTMSTNWTSWWMEIPVTFGLTFNMFNDKARIYAGAGLSYFKGAFGVDMKMDDKYTAYLTSYAGGSAPLYAAATSQKVEFLTAGANLHYLIGFSWNFVWNVAVSLEYYNCSWAQNVYSNKLNNGASRLLTAAVGGPAVYAGDPTYMKRISFPSVMGANYFRFGVIYYIL